MHARTALALVRVVMTVTRRCRPKLPLPRVGVARATVERVVLEMGFGAGGYAGSPPAGAGAE